MFSASDKEKIEKLHADPALQEWQEKGYFEWCKRTGCLPRETDLGRLNKLSSISAARRGRQRP